MQVRDHATVLLVLLVHQRVQIPRFLLVLAAQRLFAQLRLRLALVQLALKHRLLLRDDALLLSHHFHLQLAARCLRLLQQRFSQTVQLRVQFALMRRTQLLLAPPTRLLHRFDLVFAAFLRLLQLLLVPRLQRRLQRLQRILFCLHVLLQRFSFFPPPRTQLLHLLLVLLLQLAPLPLLRRHRLLLLLEHLLNALLRLPHRQRVQLLHLLPLATHRLLRLRRRRHLVPQSRDVAFVAHLQLQQVDAPRLRRAQLLLAFLDLLVQLVLAAVRALLDRQRVLGGVAEEVVALLQLYSVSAHTHTPPSISSFSPPMASHFSSSSFSSSSMRSW